MSDYSLGKIYKLVSSSNSDLCYIGSTTKTLQQRRAKHCSNYKRWKAGKYNSFVTSFKIIDDDNDAMIILLEKYPCNSRKELELRERYYIESNKCVNMVIPTRTFAEYYEDNKVRIHEYQKVYREDNKDALYAKANSKHHCDCGGDYTQKNRSVHFKTVKHQRFVKQQSD